MYYYLSLILFYCYGFWIFKYRFFIAQKLNLYDLPDNIKKTHKIQGYLLGGIILLSSIFTFLSYENELFEILIFIFFFILFFFIGLLDDMKKISIIYRALQIFFVILIFLYLLSLINSPFYPHSFELFHFSINNILLNLIIYSFLFFLTYNVLNFSDGINYIIILFVSCFFVYVCYFYYENFYIIFILILIIPLLFYFNKNMIFLGSSGILVLTYNIFFHSTYAYNIGYLKIEELLIAFSIIGTDLVRTILERLFKKQEPWIGDRTHLHHKIKHIVKSDLIIAIIICFFSFTPLVLFQLLNISIYHSLLIGLLLYFLILYIFSSNIFLKGKKYKF